MIGANATLTKVAERGSGEAYDGPPAPGAAIWEEDGGAPCYVGLQEAQTGGVGGSVAEIPTLIVQNDEVPIDWRVGLLVFYARDGEPARYATVQAFNVTRTRQPVSAAVLTTRVALAEIKLDTT
jgi:hypothetical protein